MTTPPTHATRFVVWKRKPGLPPGHAEIFVECRESGQPVEIEKGQVQCATITRIPFCMKISGLLERYESPTPLESQKPKKKRKT